MAEKLPGVGYKLKAGARSHAGDAHTATAFPLIDTTANPFAPGISGSERSRRMGQRYGPLWAAGVTGPHAEGQLSQYMEQAFAARKADWITDPRDYDRYDGHARVDEYTDAKYSKDSRVHPILDGGTGGDGGFTRPRPGGGPSPAPQPAPMPPPPSPPPDPAPTPEPPPGLSSVEQSVRELLLLAEVVHGDIEDRAPSWVSELYTSLLRRGLLKRALTHVVRIKRRVLGEDGQ